MSDEVASDVGSEPGGEAPIDFSAIPTQARELMDKELKDSEGQAPQESYPPQAEESSGAEGSPTQPTQAQPTQPAPFEYEYTHRGQAVKIGKEDLDWLVKIGFDAIEAENARRAGRQPQQQAAPPAPPPEAPKPAQPTSDYDQIRKELKEMRAWREGKEQQERVVQFQAEMEREFTAEEPKHKFLTDHPDYKETARTVATAIMATNRMLTPSRAMAMAVQALGDPFQKAMGNYVQGKIKAGQQTVERAGGSVAMPAAEKIGPKDLASGEIARRAAKMLRSSMS